VRALVSYAENHVLEVVVAVVVVADVVVTVVLMRMKKIQEV
jgi:hypothetical protein